MKNLCKYFASTFLVFSSFISFTQQTIHNDLGRFHSSLSQDTGFTAMRSMFNPLTRDSAFLEESRDEWLADFEYAKYTSWLVQNNWLGYQSNTHKFITIDPYVDMQIGSQLKPSNERIFKYRRGVLAQGQMGKRFKFFSVFSENVSRYDDYTFDWIRARKVAPGEGEVKYRGDANRSIGVLQSVGGMEIKLIDEITLTLANGKNFIGDGHRSLLLSDVATAYPFARMDFQYWRFKYSAIIGEFIDMVDRPSFDALRNKSYGAFHYLDMKLTKWWYLGLMESVIWAGDTLSRNSLDLSYLNPFIILRPQEMNLGSPDNMLIGMNTKFLPFPYWKIYGQIVLTELKSDELFAGTNWWGNKYGMQMGTRFTSPEQFPGFVGRLEYNFVRPFTYSHKTSAQAYGHFYEPLAHPMGANFNEMITQFSFRAGRFYISYNSSYAKIGKDTIAGVSVGNNIFLDYALRDGDYGHTLLQGELNRQWINEFKVAWLVNPANHLFLEFGYHNRDIWKNNGHESTQHYFIGLKTAFLNYYHDY